MSLSFLFASALWALPLAGLPVLLHMLFRRKSPVVFFSTLRFIKSSIQQTAARRRVQRWVLLACRVLLLALLIWAIAQPVRILATGWADAGPSLVAAVVVDTSYSMQLRQREVTLLDQANDIVQQLLREPLKDARVSIFHSLPLPADNPEQLQTASEILSQWSGLKPQPSPVPLSQRCASAMQFLSRQQAGQKWLIILTDLQSREFPTPLPTLDEGRLILFDLHPEKPRSFGITSVRVKPEQPIPGIGSQVGVEVSGFAGDSRAVSIHISKLDGQKLLTLGPLMATFDTAGRTTVRAPLLKGLPSERHLLLTAELPEDDLTWDNSRSQLVELPPRQSVTFVDAPTQPTASKIIRLALDPSQGGRPDWPLDVKSSADLTGREQAAVILLTDWPDEARATRLRDFARAGGTLVLLLQPGLEQSWSKLPDRQRNAIAELLPAAPAQFGGSAVGFFRPVAPARPDPIIEDIADPAAHLEKIAVRRFVPFVAAADPAVTTLLYLSPRDGDSRTQPFGLYYRRRLGLGSVFTFATLPNSRYLSPAAPPALPILLIKSCLPSSEQRDVQNIEIGQPLILAGSRFASYSELEIQDPAGQRTRVKPSPDAAGPKFIFSQTAEPGLYYCRQPADAATLAIANVQLPAAESDLIYRRADSVVAPGPNCLVVHNYADLQTSMAKLNEPEPRWSWPIAIVMVLFCFEALLGSLSQLWKPMTMRAIIPITR
jgi:hypothetical protein